MFIGTTMTSALTGNTAAKDIDVGNTDGCAESGTSFADLLKQSGEAPSQTGSDASKPAEKETNADSGAEPSSTNDAGPPKPEEKTETATPGEQDGTTDTTAAADNATPTAANDNLAKNIAEAAVAIRLANPDGMLNGAEVLAAAETTAGTATATSDGLAAPPMPPADGPAVGTESTDGSVETSPSVSPIIIAAPTVQTGEDSAIGTGVPVPNAASAPAAPAKKTAPPIAEAADSSGTSDTDATLTAGTGNAAAADPIPIYMQQALTAVPQITTIAGNAGTTAEALTDVAPSGTVTGKQTQTVQASQNQRMAAPRDGTADDNGETFADALQPGTAESGGKSRAASPEATTKISSAASGQPWSTMAGEPSTQSTATSAAAPAAALAATTSTAGTISTQATAAATLSVTSQTASDASSSLETLGLTIAAKSAEGKKHFDIRLDPPELGRIEVSMTVNDAGKAQVSLTADRPQTLALLQRDATDLTRSLADAGVDVSGNGLSFSLGGGGEQQDRSGYGGRALSITAQIEADVIGDDSVSLSAGDVRLDIRV